MSTKLPWTRLNAEQWIIDVSCMKPMEKAVYLTLSLFMRKTQEPLDEDTFLLSRYVGCTEKAFNKALIGLLRTKKIVRLDDGRLWSLEVEEELNNSNKNLEKSSIKAAKAAKARWDEKENNEPKMHKHKNHTSNDACASESDACAENLMLGNAINNNINIYNKKTNTIVLAKKETEFEDLETTDLVDEPIEVDAVESQSEQIATSSDNQPPIHEQTSIPKKAKRVKADRGCRLPADFEPDYDFAIEEGLPPERVKVEIAKFRDFWNAKAGKDASKRDWQATWRNWVRRAVENLERGKIYGKQSTEKTEQQRGWSYRVAQHMSNIKNSDSVYKFLFEDDNRTTIPLENGAKAIDCRSGESYLISP